MTDATAAQTGVFDAGQAGSLAGRDGSHWWFTSKTTIVRALAERYVLDGTGPLVDVGAGAGGISRSLRDQCAGAVCIEGSPELATACHARGLAVARALTTGLPIGSACASTVTLLDVIEHLPDPVAALREARRILKPGGVLIVTVPAHAWLWSDADVLLGHVKRYTRRMLRAELDRAGFTTRWCSHVFSWLAGPVLATRRGGVASGDAQLGLGVDSPLLRATARILTAAELALVARVPLPIGTSVAAVATPR